MVYSDPTAGGQNSWYPLLSTAVLSLVSNPAVPAGLYIQKHETVSCSQPSVSADSDFRDFINHRWKIFRGKLLLMGTI
jgi:hypothetical protein